ncbi:MAG: selenide, water dikinase SelD [Candidatus Electronema sp. V4]|uniref:selenide, water dikinase SelD n=1 Tax=Candidatus Electronema sp. V4 TaxID=3454756 RepID=UPI00405559DD
MGPAVLSDAISGFAAQDDPDLLVGFETADDAAVYRLSDEIALISTVDFITPPVDDPYWFGQIAAANSLSDVYAMGGRPVTALNLVMFPAKRLDMGILRELLRGGFDKVREAGAVLAGGHSVDDEEPKYGLCVSGTVHPQRVITNAGAQPGDAFILTKPLGSGVLFNAVRSGKYPFAELERETLPSLAALNDKAIETALGFDLHACTDVTGFGIVGHLLEVALGSGLRAMLRQAALPFYPGAAEMYRKGETTGSNKANRAMAAQHGVVLGGSSTGAAEELLFDPQTSGGLLLAVPQAQAPALLAALHQRGMTAAVCVGEAAAGQPGVTVV